MFIVCVCVLLCFCTVHSIVCLMFMMWLPYGVINYNNNRCNEVDVALTGGQLRLIN